MVGAYAAACITLLLGLAAGTTIEDGTFLRSYATEATRLRGDKLEDYDRIVAPEVTNRSVTHSDAGTDVGVEIRFFKVIGVESAHGRMQLKVWFRLQWKDERLAWDPNDYGGIQKVYYGDPLNPEAMEIWTPDLQPYNTIIGTVATLDPALVQVSSDGTCYWSRPGTIDVMCRFSGLVAFPYDELTCKLEVGGWILSDGFQGMYAMNGGFSFAQEATSRPSYQENIITKVEFSYSPGFIYDCCPNEGWPLMSYTITLDRSYTYYLFISIAPSIGFTLLAFGAFFLSHEVGERLSYGITLMLANEVTKYSVQQLLPICGETLWIDVFLSTCTLFCSLSLLESILVLYFALHNWDDDAVPVMSKAIRRCARFLPIAIKERLVKMMPTDYDHVALNLESCAAIKYRAKKDAGEITEEDPLARVPSATRQPSKLSSDAGDVSKRLIFFERLFYMLDDSAKGSIKTREFARFLSFAKLDLEDGSKTAMQMLAKSERKEEGGIFFRMDFIDVCEEMLGDTPIEQIETSWQNFQDANTMVLRRNQNFWLGTAKLIDMHSRWWIPMLFFCALAFLLNVNFEDGYDDADTDMFYGLGNYYMTTIQGIRFMIVPVLLFGSALCWLLYQRKMIAKQRRKNEKMRESVNSKKIGESNEVKNIKRNGDESSGMENKNEVVITT